MTKPRKLRLEKERWYAGFSCKGNPHDILALISRKVQEFNLNLLVPLVRIEKKAKGKFYIFIAIESQLPGKFPEEFEKYLHPLPCFQFPAVKGENNFSYEQIKSMVGPAHKVEEYTNPIPFYEKTSKKRCDPFVDLEETKQECPLAPNLINLLDWLSAKGYGSWDSCQMICNSLGLENPSRIARNFKLLGHLETSPNGKKWSITPTALVPLNDDPENLEFYLCGQQNTQLRQQLSNFAAIKSEGQLISFGLPRWRVTFPDFIKYQQIETLAGVPIYKPGNISRQLADCLPILQEWQINLPKVGGIVPSQCDWRHYKPETQDFQACILPEKTGFYEMRRDPEANFPDRTIFYEANTQTWRQGDWYGLRFLALHNEKTLQACCYSSEQKQLAVPYQQRWPQIYERALVLASGYLPQVLGDRQWLTYNNISPELANSLCQKLTLSCQGL